jgi:hypothetical protein
MKSNEQKKDSPSSIPSEPEVKEPENITGGRYLPERELTQEEIRQMVHEQRHPKLFNLQGKQTGYDYRFAHWRAVEQRKAAGWVPVQRDDPERVSTSLVEMGQSPDSTVRAQDCVLMRRRKEIGEEYRRQTKADAARLNSAVSEVVNEMQRAASLGDFEAVHRLGNEFKDMKRR